MSVIQELTSRSGLPCLVVRGEAGAASVTIRYNANRHEAYGVIDFHFRTPRREGQLQQACSIFGECYPGCPAFGGGSKVAQLWHGGDEDGAWHELRAWYESQIGA